MISLPEPGSYNKPLMSLEIPITFMEHTMNMNQEYQVPDTTCVWLQELHQITHHPMCMYSEAKTRPTRLGIFGRSVYQGKYLSSQFPLS
jgi:hypothetical protein